MIETKTPELGTSEAAVRSCVSVIAAVTGQPEQIMAYWLDLYFQVRSAHERENAKPKPAEDPTILRRGDLYPVLRELMHDALKSAKHEEAKERLAKRAKKDDAGEDGRGKPLPYETPRDIPAQESAEAEQTVAEIHGEPVGIHGPVEELGAKPRGCTAKKQLIRNQLLHARDQGVTFAQIVTASEGSITEKEIIRILNAEKVPTETYKRLEAALDALQK